MLCWRKARANARERGKRCALPICHSTEATPPMSPSPPALVPQASSAPATALDASSTAADVIAHFSTSLVGKNILVTGEFQKSFPQFSEERTWADWP
jgi:hypothetical protein